MFFFLGVSAGLIIRDAVGESVWAGDRDIRYLNCLVPCEFACGKKDLPVIEMERSPHLRFPRSVKNDLGKAGKKHYTEAVQRGLKNALRSTGTTRSGGKAVYDLAGIQYSVDDNELPLIKRLMGWNCSDQCKYTCMHRNVKLRQDLGDRTVKYYGKWAFTEVCGCQELVSSLFSAANGLPHWMFLWESLGPIREYKYYRIWFTHAFIMGLISWPSSAIFHCRDNAVTETLDYMGAQLGLTTALGCVIVQNFFSYDRGKLVALVYVPLGLLWLLHMSYLTFVDFDYGWNMMVAVVLGTLVACLWIRWYLMNRRVKPHAWLILVPSLGVYPFLVAFELLDFPPADPFLLVDAHACWHISTVALGFAWYEFARRDFAWELLHGDGKKSC